MIIPSSTELSLFVVTSRGNMPQEALVQDSAFRSVWFGFRAPADTVYGDNNTRS